MSSRYRRSQREELEPVRVPQPAAKVEASQTPSFESEAVAAQSVPDARLPLAMRQRGIVQMQRKDGNQAVRRYLETPALGDVQRDVSAVGGTQSEAVPLQRPGGAPGQMLVPGAAGYSRAMLAEVPAMANDLNSAMAPNLLRNAVFNYTGLDAQIRIRSLERTPLLESAGDFFNTPSTTKRYQDAADWAQGHIDTMQHDKTLMDQKAANYNAWVPRANGFFTSATRFGAMQGLLGATDNNSMVTALRQGLTEAQSVGQRMQGAYAGNARTEQLTVPPADNTVQESIAGVSLASQHLNDKWLGWKSKVDLVSQETTANAEGTTDRARMTEINEVKAAVHQIGGMVDTTMSVVSGAPAAIQNVSNTVNRAEAQLNASRNRSQILNGGRPTHNPTYLTTDGKGNMIVRNMQTGTDRDPVTNAATASPEGPGLALPTSVSAILDNITTFVYAGEVRRINQHLEQIKSRVSSIQGDQKLTALLQVTSEFQTALNEYAQRCNDMQNRLAQRRNAYLQFGEQLDRFAASDRESQRGGQAPQKGQERYAQIMTVISQLRELMTIARGVSGGFDSPAAFRQFYNTIKDDREHAPPRTNMHYMHVTPDEQMGFDSIYAQVSALTAQIRVINDLLGPLDAQAATVFTALSPGGGQGAY